MPFGPSRRSDGFSSKLFFSEPKPFRRRMLHTWQQAVTRLLLGFAMVLRKEAGWEHE